MPHDLMGFIAEALNFPDNNKPIKKLGLVNIS
jgi:hypothetical protein